MLYSMLVKVAYMRKRFLKKRIIIKIKQRKVIFFSFQNSPSLSQLIFLNILYILNPSFPFLSTWVSLTKTLKFKSEFYWTHFPKISPSIQQNLGCFRSVKSIILILDHFYH